MKVNVVVSVNFCHKCLLYSDEYLHVPQQLAMPLYSLLVIATLQLTVHHLLFLFLMS